MKLTRGKIALYAGIAAALAGLAWAFQTRPISVQTASAARGPLQVTVNHEGKTRIKERYIVSAPLTGRLLRVKLLPGDAVETGKTLLAAIEPSHPELLDPRAQAQAEARVKASEATVKQATPTMERLRTMWKLASDDFARMKDASAKGGVSEADLDAAHHKEQAAAQELKSAEFAAQVAVFELEQMRAALVFAQPAADNNIPVPRFEIPSPIHGRVLRLFQQSSTVVTPGTRLIELGDPTDLEMEIDVLSTDAVKVKPGTKVIVEHWGGDAPLHARVRVVEPSAFTKVSSLGVEEQRVYVIADFDDPAEKRTTLGDGFRIEARIVIWESNDVLKVPAGALFREQGEWSVFTVKDDRAHLQRVQVGHRNDLEAEITSGLSEGDSVVLYPSDQITDGTKVERR